MAASSRLSDFLDMSKPCLFAVVNIMAAKSLTSSAFLKSMESMSSCIVDISVYSLVFVRLRLVCCDRFDIDFIDVFYSPCGRNFFRDIQRVCACAIGVFHTPDNAYVVFHHASVDSYGLVDCQGCRSGYKFHSDIRRKKTDMSLKSLHFLLRYSAIGAVRAICPFVTPCDVAYFTE